MKRYKYTAIFVAILALWGSRSSNAQVDNIHRYLPLGGIPEIVPHDEMNELVKRADLSQMQTMHLLAAYSTYLDMIYDIVVRDNTRKFLDVQQRTSISTNRDSDRLSDKHSVSMRVELYSKLDILEDSMFQIIADGSTEEQVNTINQYRRYRVLYKLSRLPEMSLLMPRRELMCLWTLQNSDNNTKLAKYDDNIKSLMNTYETRMNFTARRIYTNVLENLWRYKKSRNSKIRERIYHQSTKRKVLRDIVKIYNDNINLLFTSLHDEDILTRSQLLLKYMVSNYYENEMLDREYYGGITGYLNSATNTVHIDMEYLEATEKDYVRQYEILAKRLFHKMDELAEQKQNNENVKIQRSEKVISQLIQGRSELNVAFKNKLQQYDNNIVQRAFSRQRIRYGRSPIDTSKRNKTGIIVVNQKDIDSGRFEIIGQDDHRRKINVDVREYETMLTEIMNEERSREIVEMVATCGDKGWNNMRIIFGEYLRKRERIMELAEYKDEKNREGASGIEDEVAVIERAMNIAIDAQGYIDILEVNLIQRIEGLCEYTSDDKRHLVRGMLGILCRSVADQRPRGKIYVDLRMNTIGKLIDSYVDCVSLNQLAVIGVQIDEISGLNRQLHSSGIKMQCIDRMVELIRYTNNLDISRLRQYLLLAKNARNEYHDNVIIMMTKMRILHDKLQKIVQQKSHGAEDQLRNIDQSIGVLLYPTIKRDVIEYYDGRERSISRDISNKNGSAELEERMNDVLKHMRHLCEEYYGIFTASGRESEISMARYSEYSCMSALANGYYWCLKTKRIKK